MVVRLPRNQLVLVTSIVTGVCCSDQYSGDPAYSINKVCARCGASTIVTYPVCSKHKGGTSSAGTCSKQKTCSNCTNGKITTTCTHGYSSSHTYTAACSHGNTSSHYEPYYCSHGYQSSHYHCSHTSNASSSSHTY